MKDSVIFLHKYIYTFNACILFFLRFPSMNKYNEFIFLRLSVILCYKNVYDLLIIKQNNIKKLHVYQVVIIVTKSASVDVRLIHVYCKQGIKPDFMAHLWVTESPLGTQIGSIGRT